MGQFKDEQDHLKFANDLFEEEKYSEAYTHYLQLLPSFRLDPDVNFKYGTCLLHVSEDKSEALPYLNLGATKGSDARAYFFLGKAYHLMYKFSVAKGHYEKFKSSGEDDHKEKYQVDLHIRMCSSGKKLLNNLTELVVEEKTRTSVSKFPYSYDLSNIGGRIIISEEFQSKLDEKREFRSMTYVPPIGTGNDVIFYSSYGKKGETGLDLYAVKRLPNGEWGEEQRLPDHINTPYDDAYGFLHASKTVFYFCSKGHNSMGGYDIFKCSYDLMTNTFGPAVNLDYKINTPDDDIMYVVDSLEENAYFASGRAAKYGFIDVYKVRVETFPLINVLLAGNFENKILAGDNATIKIKDDRNDEIIGIYNPKQDGKYTILLPKSGNYTFIVETENSEKIHQSPVVVPPQKEFKPLKQKIILTNESGVEQLIIQNLFDEEFTEEERETLIADAMQSMADPEVNADDFEDVITQDDKDSVLAMDDNFTLDDIESMAKGFYEDAQAEADKLKAKMDAAFAVANQKSKEAAENAAAAEEILNSLDEIENPLERQQQADLAKELNSKAKDQYVQATTAFNLANGLKDDYERAQSEADESKLTYESIQATLDEEDHEKAIAQLTSLKEKIEKIIYDNSDEDVVKKVGAQAKAKKEEVNQALAEGQEFREEEQKLNSRINQLKGDLEKAKDKDKPAIQVQIDELEEQAAMNKKWAEESFEEAERLDKEALALDHQAQLLVDLDGDLANSSTGLTDAERAELEKFMNDNDVASGIENNDDALGAYKSGDGSNDLAENNSGSENGSNGENTTDGGNESSENGNDGGNENNGSDETNGGNENNGSNDLAENNSGSENGSNGENTTDGGNESSENGDDGGNENNGSNESNGGNENNGEENNGSNDLADNNNDSENGSNGENNPDGGNESTENTSDGGNENEETLTPSSLVKAADNIKDDSELAAIANDPNLSAEEKLVKENAVLQEWIDEYDYKVVEANKGLLETSSQEERDEFFRIREEFEEQRDNLESKIAQNNDLIASSQSVSNGEISDEYQELINTTEKNVSEPEDYSGDLSETESYFSEAAAEELSKTADQRDELSIKEQELSELQEEFDNETKEKKKEKIQDEIDEKNEEILGLKTDLGVATYDIDGMELELNDNELVAVIEEVKSNVEGYENDENYLKAEIYNNTAEEQRSLANDKVDEASRTTDSEEKAALLEEAHALNTAAIDNQREAITLLDEMTDEEYVASTISTQKSGSDLAAKNGNADNPETNTSNGGNESDNGNNGGNENNGSNDLAENANGTENGSNGENTSDGGNENNGEENNGSNDLAENANGAENGSNGENTSDGGNENNGEENNGSDDLSENNNGSENGTNGENTSDGGNENNGSENSNNGENETDGGNESENGDLASNNTTSNNSGSQKTNITIESITQGEATVSSLLNQTEKQATASVPDQDVLDKTYNAEEDNPDAYEVSTEVESISYSSRSTDFDSDVATEVFNENEKVLEKINDYETDKIALNLEAKNAQTEKDKAKIEKKVDKLDRKIDKQESKLHEDIQVITEGKVDGAKNNLKTAKISFGDLSMEESTNMKQSEEYEEKADQLVAEAEDLRTQAENEKDKTAKSELLKQANSKEFEAIKYYNKASDLYIDAATQQQKLAIDRNESPMSSEELTEKSEELSDASSKLMNESVSHRDSSLTAKGEVKIGMIQRAEDKEKQANTLAVLANEFKASATQQADKEAENEEKENLLANLSPEDVENVKSADEYQEYFDAENQKNELKVQKAKKEGERNGLENIILQQTQDLKQLENDKKNAKSKQEEDEIQDEIAVLEDAIIANDDRVEELEEAIESLDVLIKTAENSQDNIIASLPSDQQSDAKAIMVSNYDKTPVKKTSITFGDLISSDFEVPDKVDNDIIVLDQNIQYSDDNPIPLNPKYPDGLIYKVQVGAFSKPIPNDVFSGFAPITGEQVGSGDLVRYRVGYFVQYDNANDAKNQIRGFGYSDAFVVAIYNGERISNSEARTIEQQSGVENLANNGGETDNTNNNTANNNQNEDNTTANNGNNGGNEANTGDNNGNETNNGNNGETDNNAGNESNNGNSEVEVDLGNGAARTNDADKIEGLFFTVQLGAFSNPIQATDVYNISPLVTKFIGNLYKYSTGIYRSVDDAVQRKNEVVALGNTDAFVTVYYDGERITVAKAQELIAEQGESVFAASEDGTLKQLSGSNTSTSQPGNEEIEIVEVQTEGKYFVDLGTYEGELPTDLANAMLLVPEYTIQTVQRGTAQNYYVGFFDNEEDAYTVIDLYNSKGINNLNVGTNPAETEVSGPAAYPGVEYRVYLGTYEGEVPGTRGIVFVDLKDEGVEKKVEDDGSETYYVGRKGLYSEALEVKKKFTARGVNIAEVRAFKDGAPINLDEARQLTNE